MISQERTTHRHAAYECEVDLKEGTASPPFPPAPRAVATAVVFILASWGIGTLILIGQGECTVCLDAPYILVAIYGGAVVVLLAAAVCSFCAVCVVGMAQLATPSPES